MGVNFPFKELLESLGFVGTAMDSTLSKATALAPALERVMGSTMKVPTTTGPAHSAAATRDFEQAQRQEYMSAFEDMRRFQGPVMPGRAVPGSPYSVSAAGDLLKSTGTEQDPRWTSTGASLAWDAAQRRSQQDLFAKFHGAGPLKIDNYGAKDIFRTSSIAKESEGLATTLERQAKIYEKNTPGSAQAGVATDIAGLLKTNKKEFESALGAYTQARLEPENKDKLIQATEKLAATMAQLNKTAADANEVAKQGPAGGGGGGLLSRVTTGGVLTAAGAVGSAYMAYRHINDAVSAATLGADMGTFANQSQLRAGQLSREANYYANVNTAEGMMRNRGDILLKDPSFLGSKGLESAAKESLKKERDRLDLVESQRNTNALGGMIAGALGGAALGTAALPVVGTVIGGILGGAGGLVAGATNFAGSEATARSGLLGTGAQNRAFTQSAINVQAGAEALREQDLATKQRETMGLGVMMEMQAAQYKGALSAGAGAMTKSRMMELTTAGEIEPIYTHTMLSPRQKTWPEKGIGSHPPEFIKTLDKDAMFEAGLKKSSVFSESQMGQAEYMEKYNAMLGVISGPVPAAGSAGGKRLETQALEINRLERAGLGSFQQNTANMGILSSISGKQDSFRDLEGILGNAVAAGFNRAEMAQNFVRVTANLAAAIGTTSPDAIGGRLSRDATLFSASGVATPFSTQVASEAIQKYDAASKSSGLMQTARTINAIHAGATVGGGLGTLVGMSNVQLLSASANLKKAKRFSDITDIRIQDMAREYKRTHKDATEKQAIDFIASQANATVSGSNTVMMEQTRQLKPELAAMRENLLKRKGVIGKNDKELQAYFSAVGTIGGALREGGESVYKEAAAIELEQAGKLKAGSSDKAKLDADIKAGQERTKDTVKQSLQRFLDATVRTAKGETTGVGLGEYKEFVKNSGGAARVMVDGKELDTARLERLQGQSKKAFMSDEDKDYLEKGNKALKDADRNEMAREASIKMREVTTTPKVFIENWDGIRQYLEPGPGAVRAKTGKEPAPPG